jgi:hypothetical protein
MRIDREIINRTDEAKYYTFFALDVLAEMFSQVDFWKELRREAKKNNFAHTNTRPTNIVDCLWSAKITHGLRLDFYRTRWFWQKKVIAHVKNGSTIICMNTNSFKFLLPSKKQTEAQIKFFIADKVRTLGHEFVHVADNLHKEYFFGHGSNTPKNELTFPEFFGDFCRKKYLDSLADKAMSFVINEFREGA